MTIVLQDYNNFINNFIKTEISKVMTMIQMDSINPIFRYINMMEQFDDMMNKTIISSIQSYLEQLDDSYTHSSERKKKYYIKDYCSLLGKCFAKNKTKNEIFKYLD